MSRPALASPAAAEGLAQTSAPDLEGEEMSSVKEASEYGEVNQCTPLDHMVCIYRTGWETFDDGQAGKASRHWFTWSLIGQACRDQYGTPVAGTLEGLFALPHYIGIALVNGWGYLWYLLD